MMRIVMAIVCLLVSITAYSQKEKHQAADTSCIRSMSIRYKNVPENAALFDTTNPYSLLSILKQSAFLKLFDKLNYYGTSVTGISQADLNKITKVGVKPMAIPGIKLQDYSEDLPYFEDLKIGENRLDDSIYYSVDRISEIQIDYVKRKDSLGNFLEFEIEKYSLLRLFPEQAEPLVVLSVTDFFFMRKVSGWILEPLKGYTESLDHALTPYFASESELDEGLAVGYIDELDERYFDKFPNYAATGILPDVEMLVTEHRRMALPSMVHGGDSVIYLPNGEEQLVYPPNDTVFIVRSGFTHAFVELWFGGDNYREEARMYPRKLLLGIAVEGYSQPILALTIDLENKDVLRNRDLWNYIQTTYGRPVRSLDWYQKLLKRTFTGQVVLQKGCYEPERN